MGNFKIGTQILLGYLMLVLILLGMVAVLSGLLLSIDKNAVVLTQDIIPMAENAPIFKQTLQRTTQDLHGHILIEKETYLAIKNILSATEGALRALDDFAAEEKINPAEGEQSQFLTKTLLTTQKALRSITEGRPIIEANIDLIDQIVRDIMEIVEWLSKSSGHDSLLVTTKIKEAVGQVLWIFFIGLSLTVLAATIGGGFIIHNVNRRIKMATEQLRHGVHGVDSSADTLAETTIGIATGASSSAASLNTTEEAIAELMELTKSNSEDAADVAQVMRETRQNFVATMESVAELGKAMNEISSSGQQIGKIIKTIDEIAFQTNLLALNAAVESARAGEAGAGFAVVADEVRNLAVRSAEAARSTNDLISKTVNGIMLGGELLKKTEDTFNAVGDELRQIGRKVTHVAETSRKQAVDIDQIKLAMTQIGKITNDNSAASENSAAAAAALHLQTKELMGSINNLNAMIHSQEQITGKRRIQLKQVPISKGGLRL